MSPVCPRPNSHLSHTWGYPVFPLALCQPPPRRGGRCAPEAVDADLAEEHISHAQLYGARARLRASSQGNFTHARRLRKLRHCQSHAMHTPQRQTRVNTHCCSCSRCLAASDLLSWDSRPSSLHPHCITTEVCCDHKEQCRGRRRAPARRTPAPGRPRGRTPPPCPSLIRPQRPRPARYLVMRGGQQLRCLGTPRFAPAGPGEVPMQCAYAKDAKMQGM